MQCFLSSYAVVVDCEGLERADGRRVRKEGSCDGSLGEDLGFSFNLPPPLTVTVGLNLIVIYAKCSSV